MSAAFRIRPVRPDDERQVSALLAAAYPKLMAGAYPEALLAKVLPLMTQANPALLASGTFYLAETGESEVIGCGGWTFEHPGSGERVTGLAHIRHFASHPDRVRQGIGRVIAEPA